MNVICLLFTSFKPQGAVIFSKPNGPLGERSGHSKNNSRLYCFGLCRSQTLPPDPLGCEQPIFRFILKIDRKNIKNTFLTIATASGHTYTYQRTIDLTSRSTLHALPSYQCCEKTLLRCLPNTEIILITPYGLFCVSSRHNYGKFRLHGLQPSCQDTMPSGSLTCEIPILEVAKKHGMRSKSSSPLEFFY